MTLKTTVDLRSDTITRPTEGMREAMRAAEVGDDVFGEDPTVNALETRVALMLGMDAALFVPSGTMANLLALMAQTRPGDCVLLHEDAHPFNYESGNIAAVAGLLPKPLTGELGILAPATIEAAYNPGTNHHYAPTTLTAVECTTNRGGGNLYSPEQFADIAALCGELGMKLHCDGARIFNAVVASGHDVSAYAEHVDTMCFCFSKGLGAPVGSVLAGPAETIGNARRFRKMLGGGMRQAGVLAAAADYALDHHISLLAEDHRRAARFRDALDALPEATVPLPSPTNMVYLDVPEAAKLAERLADEGVLAIPTSPARLRFVFHLDIDDAALDYAIDVVVKCLTSKN